MNVTASSKAELTRITTPNDMQSLVKAIQRKKQRIGLVATMGCLHDGHIALLNRAKQENDITILSIFVNPTQFNDAKDFNNYPDTLSADEAIAKKHGVNYLFLPSKTVVYPDNYQYKLSENRISRHLEGDHRPGHFDGVLTVIMKLLQIIKPDSAYFGEKDYQQYLLIKGMVSAFFLDTCIVACPTVRDENGLAHSSRNALLSPEQRRFAAHFAKALASRDDCDTIKAHLTALGFQVDYIEDHDHRRYGAVFLDGVRLIDNRAL